MRSLVVAAAVALALAAPFGCRKKPVESSTGSTDTIQSAPQTTGTTATETGGGPPVTTSNATATTVTTATTATTATTSTTTAGTAGTTGTH